MLKYKLPKDWIAVDSKSHPDRVYYFNVKTNQSSWIQPTLDKTDETSSANKCGVHEERNHRDGMIPERNVEEADASRRQQSLCNKITEIPRTKADRVKALRRSDARNKPSFSSLETLCSKTVENKKREKNTGYRKNNTARKHDDIKRNEKKNENIQKLYGRSVSRRGEELVLKKNLMRERMRRIRSLNIEEEKFEETCRADLIDEKASRRDSKDLPNSSDDNSLESTRVCKNVDIRFERLRNRILKDIVYERKIKLKDDKSHGRNNGPIVEHTTKDVLIEQAERKVLYEEMDWEPMKDEEIALEVEVVRTQLGRDNRVETKCTSENDVELTRSDEMESREKGPLYIVVDTNVFLSNLEIIEKAKDTTFENYPRPFIVIPWTVICELDYLKDNKSKYELATKARRAISFIHNQFSCKHPRVVGQSREQAAKNKEDFSLDCPDDEILQCCLQIRRLRKSVILLSYDKNLCTKAMIYDILTLGRHDPLEKIDYFDTNDTIVDRSNDGLLERSLFGEELRLTDNIFEDAKLTMRNFLSTIITKQMSEIYGETEWKMYVVIKPPWTIITALKCAIKHWIAAINESFQRRAEYILKELLDAFVHIPDGGRKLQQVEYILEKSNDLVQMVNTDKHCDLMTQTFGVITELKEKCKKYIADINLKKLHDKIGIADDVQEQEIRAEKVFQCFRYIYNYARDICGLACDDVGMAFAFAFKSADPPLSQALVQRLRSEIARKVTDLTRNLNKLLVQTEDSIKHQTLLSLQQNLNTFLPDTERIIFDVAPLDIYYCVKLKEETLKTGLRQLRELTSHFCALAART